MLDEATPRIAVLSCSLNPESRSYQLARASVAALEATGARATLTDLRDYDLPLCGPDSAYSAPPTVGVKKRIAEADAIVVAAPVYNYDVNAAAKNLVELTGSAWNGKPVALVCAAGGGLSYMAPLGFLNSLMLDFRSLVVPRFVYARKGEVELDGTLSERIGERIAQMAKALTDQARAAIWLREEV